MTLNETIESKFKANSARTFLIDQVGGKSLTYAEFHKLACHVAGMFHQFGLKRGSRVGVLLNNSREFAAIYFGALFSGVVVVPINQALSAGDIHFLIQNSELDLLIFSMCTRPIVMKSPDKIRCRQVCILQGSEREFHPEVTEIQSVEDFPHPPAGWQPDVRAEDTIAIVFTSGTTSRPKGIKHRASTYFEAAAAFNEGMGFGPENRFFNMWPMAYNTGWLNSLLCPFLAEGSVVISGVYDAKTPLNFWRQLTQHDANTIWLSPSMMAALNRVDRDPTGPNYAKTKMRSVLAGTAPLPLRVKRDFEAKYGIEVFESYGVSEVLFVSMNMPRFERRPQSTGRIIKGIEIALVDESGAPTPDGTEGEIVVRSPWMMQAYVDFDNAGSPTRKPMDDFPTGDIGRLDSEGNLFITGRKKDIIIRGGLNISPRSIEEVLLDVPIIEQAAVIGIPHEIYGEEIIAAVQLKGSADLSAESFGILKHCRENLSPNSVPSKLLQFEKLPQGSTGKILKREIRTEVLQRLGQTAK